MPANAMVFKMPSFMLNSVSGDAPIQLTLFAGVGVFQIAFLLAVTLRWKISGHSATTAGFAIFIVALFGPVAAPVFLLIPLVAWSRIRRNRHEFTQTIAGSLAGIIYTLTALYLVHLNGVSFTLV